MPAYEGMNLYCYSIGLYAGNHKSWFRLYTLPCTSSSLLHHCQYALQWLYRWDTSSDIVPPTQDTSAQRDLNPFWDRSVKNRVRKSKQSNIASGLVRNTNRTSRTSGDSSRPFAYPRIST